MCFYSSCSNTWLSLHVIIPVIFGEYMRMLKVKQVLSALAEWGWKGRYDSTKFYEFFYLLMSGLNLTSLVLELQTPTSYAHVQFPLPLILES